MIDLHTHSTASDGTDTPSGLVSRAAALGLGALALTDHDTVAGLDEAGEAAADAHITFVRGCEISTRTEYGSVHILGLWLPADCAELDLFFQDLRARRGRRNEEMVAKLQGLGIKIDMEELRQKAAATVGRPHMAQLLVEKGYVRDLEEAFDVYLGENGKAYAPKFSLTPETALGILKKHGATTIMAHPLLKNWPLPRVTAFIEKHARNGLDGIEVWHSAHSPEQMRFLHDLAGRFSLCESGGSDYHGLNKPNISLGSGNNNLHIPDAVLEKLAAYRKKNSLPC